MKASQWIDISVPLKSGMVHWPDDPAIKIKRVRDMARGDICTVSTLSMGSHTGTHIDAPSHFVPRGKAVDAMPFPATVGLARVIAIDDAKSVKPEELDRHQIRRGERILFKTSNSARCWKNGRFVKNFVGISLAAARYLARRRIQAVGIDYLSVGGFHDDGAAIHRELLRAGVWIIEGLNLARVKPGKYELICLPIKISHGDGAPARAILKPI